ncbi:MAG: T9SS C-terminal target domain-containing protein [bacterium]
MKHLVYIFLMMALVSSLAVSQRDFKTHTRSMVRQTIYNTGEIGRATEASNSTTVGLPEGTSSLEWPPNSRQTLNQIVYWGHQNSFGGGILFQAKINGTYVAKACGGITDGSGNATTIAGIYSIPGSITRTENYPLLADGSLNTAYNPNEAEEIIVTQYTTTNPMKLLITQTSRAWSFPGYDAFIIIEYDIVNTDAVDYTDGMVMFFNGLCPSALGIQRRYGVWNESSVTTRAREVYGRYNFTRYMLYVHSRDGFPDPTYFNAWSTEGNRGGLNSPQGVGLMVLHYDYENLQPKSMTSYTLTDTARAWDQNGKFLQPYTAQQVPNRNVDLSASRAIAYGLTLSSRPYTSFDFKSTTSTVKTDSVNWATYYGPSIAQNPAVNLELMNYWQGRAKPRALSSGNYTQTSMHYTSFGPYVFPRGKHLKFAIATLVGYGPGTAADTVYRDAGGAFSSSTAYYEPVISWYDSLTYPGLSGLSGINYMGSAYLKNNAHKLPWYVAGKISNVDPSPVISLRDVADRAIQIYTGGPLVDYDAVQFKPENSPATGLYGVSKIHIPFPAPVLNVYDAADVKNKIVWGPQVESFTSMPAIKAAAALGRIRSGLSHYLVMKSPDGLGPWTRLDSVGIRDPRYYNKDEKYPDMYVFKDTQSLLSENYYYCVLSVDSVGGKSGYTNITYHSTQKGAVEHLGGKIYVAPNPLILSSSFGGSTKEGDINDKIGFYGLPKNAVIRIFSYSGQLVGTIEHTANVYSHEWFQISRNSQRIAAGVYFYVVEDLDEGTRATGKFVIIH